MIDKILLKEIQECTPLALLAITDKELINRINNLVPYSTGFEIECNYRQNCYVEENFRTIPDIMHVYNDSTEQRYRIPNGLKGIICLYNICEQLRINSELNPLSGIHYHVDCTDYSMQLLLDENFMKTNEQWILNELSTWKYKGTYNSKGISIPHYHTGNWMRNNTGTLEFRIGEMTFDFKLLLERITHCNEIVRVLKEKIHTSLLTFDEVDRDKILFYYKNSELMTPLLTEYYLLSNNLEKLEAPIKKTDEQIVVRNRLHKINK